MAKTTKEVAVKPSSDLAELENLEWAAPELDGDEQRLPGLHLISPASDLAKEGTIAPGTFVNMATKEEMGRELEIIPFHFGRVWRRYNDEDKMVSVVKATSRYDFKWKREEDPDGYRNEYCFDFYVLVPDSPEVPFVLSFKATNADEGRKLAGVMAQNGKIPCRKAVSLSSITKQSKNGRKWMAKDFKVGRASTNEEVLKCHSWLKDTVEYHNNTFYTPKIEAKGQDPEQQSLNF